MKKKTTLDRVLEYLKTGGPKTTRDILNNANVLAVNTKIDHLRKKGHLIRCNRVKDIYYYTLLPF